jgi:hypothetical protein
MDVLDQRVRRQRCLEGEVVAQAFGVELSRECREREEGRQRRSCHQAAAMLAPEQRLDAEPVSGEEDAAICAVVDGEGEHAVEPCQHRFAPVQVARQQHLAVGSRGEGAAGGFEFAAQRGEVVDLAVVDHGVATVGRRHRLAAAVDVDHRQPRVAEQGGAVGQHFACIRSARLEARQRGVEVRTEGVADGEQDAAHQKSSRARASQADSARSAA